MQQSCHNITECKGQFVCKPVRYNFECWQANYHRLDECLQVINVSGNAETSSTKRQAKPMRPFHCITVPKLLARSRKRRNRPSDRNYVFERESRSNCELISRSSKSLTTESGQAWQSTSMSQFNGGSCGRQRPMQDKISF